MEKETWLPVVGYEGSYIVSSAGRVFSQLSDKMLAMHFEKGYLRVTLSKEGKQKKEYVHRLVAMAFHTQPHKGYEVNHKDGNKINNESSNLEWVTHRGNVEHAASLGLTPPLRPVTRKCKCGETVKFASLYEAAKANFKGNDREQQTKRITRAATKGNMCGGYYWEFLNE